MGERKQRCPTTGLMDIDPVDYDVRCWHIPDSPDHCAKRPESGDMRTLFGTAQQKAPKTNGMLKSRLARAAHDPQAVNRHGADLDAASAAYGALAEVRSRRRTSRQPCPSDNSLMSVPHFPVVRPEISCCQFLQFPATDMNVFHPSV